MTFHYYFLTKDLRSEHIRCNFLWNFTTIYMKKYICSIQRIMYIVSLCGAFKGSVILGYEHNWIGGKMCYAQCKQFSTWIKYYLTVWSFTSYFWLINFSIVLQDNVLTDSCAISSVIHHSSELRCIFDDSSTT